MHYFAASMRCSAVGTHFLAAGTAVLDSLSSVEGSLPVDSWAVGLLVVGDSSVADTIAPDDFVAAYSVADNFVEEVPVLAAGRLVAEVAVVAGDRMALAVHMVVAQIVLQREKVRWSAVAPKGFLPTLLDQS